MTATTIRLAPEVRDRLNALAESEGRTAGSMVEKLLEQYLRHREVELAVTQMNAMTPAESEAYLAEFRELDASLADGLEDW